MLNCWYCSIFVLAAHLELADEALDEALRLGGHGDAAERLREGERCGWAACGPRLARCAEAARRGRRGRQRRQRSQDGSAGAAGGKALGARCEGRVELRKVCGARLCSISLALEPASGASTLGVFTLKPP
jgi:hypothetical protein